MSMGLNELKKKYNEVLAREKKARKFINGATDEQFKKWYQAYLDITIELSGMMDQYYKLTGERMSENEVFEGFQI